jgi:pyruvate dehydrogenase E1 component
MYAEQEDVYYYITVMNENYPHPALPPGAEPDILKGMYLLREGSADSKAPRVQLLGSGTILREVMAAADILEKDFGVVADIWSVTSFNELRRDGLEVQRWNMLHPEAEPRQSHIERCLKDRSGPVISATDYMKVFSDQVRGFIAPRRFHALGTDGFGRSDTRAQLRKFFEVDRHYVTVAALKALADSEAVPAAKVSEAIRTFGIDPDRPNPATV